MSHSQPLSKGRGSEDSYHRDENLRTQKKRQLHVVSFLWYHQDSNRGHTDFQSDALPTELWHHCFSFAGAKVGISF